MLSTVVNALNPPTLPVLPGIPAACKLKAHVLNPLSLEGGAITISPTTGTISVNLARLLTELGLNINRLPANTDLLAYLLNFITDPHGLSAGLQRAITDLAAPLQKNLTKCLNVLPAPLNALAAVFNLITAGQSALTNAVNSILIPLQDAAGPNPLKPLADGLKQLIDIGINVQSGPGIQPVQSDPALLFTTALAKTPNQDTPVVANQTLIRALEIHLIGARAAVIALANAAVGPSTAAPVLASTPASTTPAGPLDADIPTGVPAGYATPSGSPDLTLILLAVGLMMAGGGAVAWKFRGTHVV